MLIVLIEFQSITTSYIESIYHVTFVLPSDKKSSSLFDWGAPVSEQKADAFDWGLSSGSQNTADAFDWSTPLSSNKVHFQDELELDLKLASDSDEEEKSDAEKGRKLKFLGKLLEKYKQIIQTIIYS